jgi:hypothetical protein
MAADVATHACDKHDVSFLDVRHVDGLWSVVCCCWHVIASTPLTLCCCLYFVVRNLFGRDSV